MKLPNAEQAQVDREKIVGYLLSVQHEKGKSKALFFQHFGFRVEEWEKLANALKAHAVAHPVTKQVVFEHGTLYIIEGDMETPSGRRPKVRTVWIMKKGTTSPRLVTSYARRDGK